MMRMNENSKGFTILEMLIAMTVFSVLLLITSTAVVGLSRQYYRGLVMARVQETARTVSEEIANNIKYSSSTPSSITSGSVESWCISETKYSFIEGYQLIPGSAVAVPAPGSNQTVPAVLVREKGCSAPSSTLAAPSGDNTELLGQNMRVAMLNITRDSSLQYYNIRVRIVFGPDDVLNNPNDENAECKGGTGSQFCAVADYTVSVVRRL